MAMTPFGRRCLNCDALEGSMHAPNCPQEVYSNSPPEEYAASKPAVKQQVRIIMEGGSFMDLEPPPDFQFAAFVQSIRAMDHFMNGKVYIPGDKILAIILWDATNPPVMVNAPSTETKQ